MDSLFEIWKPVPSLPGIEASSFGRVRSGTAKPTFGTWDKEEERHVRRLNVSGKQVTFRVHFAVCEAFHGPRPFAMAVVMHDDENSRNNREENLKWGTQEQN